MTSTSDIVNKWATGKPSSARSRNVFVDRGSPETIYSYGHHFPLGTFIHDRALAVLNGDRYSSSTTWHQSMVRCAVAREQIPNVIIPFSALLQAGISIASRRRRDVPMESIEVLDRQEDRTEIIPHYFDTLPADAVRRETPAFSCGGWCGTDYSHRDTEQHWHVNKLGETGERVTVEPPPTVSYHTSGDKYATQYREQPDGRWFYESYRHWLGACLFQVDEQYSMFGMDGQMTLHTKKVKYLSAFDEQERTPLYFLCELPECDATTIEEAIEALKPEAVLQADRDGIQWTRQGDIFAIPLTGWKPPRGAETAKRDPRTGPSFTPIGDHLLGTNHVATESVVIDGETYARGCLYHDRFRPEHARRKMGDGKTWHLIVKNTVPVRAGRNRAWTIGGGVD